MPDEIPGLETNNLPASQPPRVVGEGYLTCDFCECKLTQRGEVYQMSTKAKQIRDEADSHEKAIAKRDEEIARLNQENAEKDRTIVALQSSVTGPKKEKFL